MYPSKLQSCIYIALSSFKQDIFVPSMITNIDTIMQTAASQIQVEL